MPADPLRFGTRASTMALAQTRAAMAMIKAKTGLDSAIETFQPVGDRDQTSKLEKHGGKGGAFVAEIRSALRGGRLNVAMHSLKDMPGDEEAPGLMIGAYLPRESARDALVLRPGLTLDAFQAASGKGYRIGTNAVRRAAFLRRIYPQSEIIHYRGAADTRLRKLDAGEKQRLTGGGAVGPADALVMAEAGLARVGAGARAAHIFEAADLLPAVGQGIVALECRSDDFETLARLAAIDDPTARAEALAEREVLWVLNGHCNSPIAGHARHEAGMLHLAAAVLALDGERILEAAASGSPDRPRELGRRVGFELLAQGAEALIESARMA